MPIRVLDPKTIARIAAGEVIERPASVVKELVENALDAGATQVTIETRGGGVSYIRVIDNGAGIAHEDAETAFARHATSKLNRIEDLESLATLGFRGEALPSIAAVAEVDLATSHNGSEGGDYVSLREGDIATHTSLARPRGTTVTVKNLFRSLPARLKFLKSVPTENSHIARTVSQAALACPEVKFTLLMEGRAALQTPGSGRVLDSIIEVYGLETAQHMVEIAGTEADRDLPAAPPELRQAGALRVSGLVSSPVISRSGRDGLAFFVNRRVIASRLLTAAVEEAYTGLLMQGRHPVAVLSIAVPPGQVDVNVHPAKSEVKFQDERGVFTAVQRAVRAALVNLAPVPRIEEAAAVYQGSRPAAGAPLPFFPERQMTSAAAALPAARPGLPPLRVIGQVASSYIVAEGPEGLYVIDQHAAHERVLYERVRAQRAGQKTEVQGLLSPATLEVTPAQDAVLRTALDELNALGFGIEPFGERTYLVRTVPAALRESDWLPAVREFLDDPLRRDPERAEAIIKTIACHGAVRAGQSLTDDAMRALLRQLEQADSPFTCPHGRPTLIHLGLRQLEREFGRT